MAIRNKLKIKMMFLIHTEQFLKILNLVVEDPSPVLSVIIKALHLDADTSTVITLYNMSAKFKMTMQTFLVVFV